MTNRFTFEHELSKKTKGNSQFEMLTRAEIISATDYSLSEASRKLLELEYGYAKDNAILAITQRSQMMRVYLAIIGILAGAAFALVREGKVKEVDLEVIFGMALFAAASSIYYMRGLIILRSDWRDYLEVMARIKSTFVLIESPDKRSFLLDRALYHDPFRLPSKSLKTNFFYHSFILCVLSLLSSTAAAIIIVAYSIVPDLVMKIGETSTLGMMIALFAITMFITVKISSLVWDKALAEDITPPSHRTDIE